MTSDNLDRLAIRMPTPMRYADLHPPFDRFMAPAEVDILATPSMMSDNERVFLYNLARRYYRGLGRIVDAGIFLGGSTCCFAEGIYANAVRSKILERWPKPVLSLERAVVSPTMPAFFERHQVGLHYQPGDSFSDLLEGYIAPHKEVVELRVGDILEKGSLEDRIEILFLDVLKMQVIGAFAIREYFPKLIPGRSIVVQQDYFFEGLPFIKTYQEFFAEEFEYIGEVGSSAIFRCRSQVNVDRIERLLAGLSVEEQLYLSAVALQRSHDPLRRLMMSMSRTLLIHDLRGKSEAHKYLDFIKAEFAPFLNEKMLPRLKAPMRELQRLCDPN